MRARRRRALRDERGFSLAELLVTCAIIGMLMAAVLVVQLTANTTFFVGENQASAQQSARYAMLMEEDLRKIGAGYPVTQPAITAATATQLTFWGDLTAASTVLIAQAGAGANTLTVAGTTGIKSGDIVYLINGNQWQQFTAGAVGPASVALSAAATVTYPAGAQVGHPDQTTYAFAGGTLSKNGQVLATGIQSMAFTYYDANDVATTTLANIRRVEIQTTATTSTPGAASTFTITASVRPRNL